ncbi:MAG TPA: Xaa-Pro peptidase family protein [Bacilli bacterium]
MEHQQRIQNLQKKLAQAGVDAYLVTQNVDIFYLTGSMQTGYVLVPVAGEPVFYVRRSVLRANEESVVPIIELGSLKTFNGKLKASFPDLFADGREIAVAADFDVLPVQIYQRLKSALPAVKWIDGSAMIRELRMIKSDYEIGLLKQAAVATDLAFQHGIAKLSAGMTELEFISEIELSLRRQGHMGVMRMRGYNQELITGIVSSGAAAAAPTYFDGPAGGEGLGAASPQGVGVKKIAAGEPILIDIGCTLNGYVTDQTRTAVIGDLPADLLHAYETAERILAHAESMLKPGVICEDLYVSALAYAKEAGLENHFMGFGKDQVKFLGHGIGLEVDEFPVLAKGFRYPLEAGMVLAVEPKFTFPGRGVVGIENTYVITDSGFERLTQTPGGLLRI